MEMKEIELSMFCNYMDRAYKYRESNEMEVDGNTLVFEWFDDDYGMDDYGPSVYIEGQEDTLRLFIDREDLFELKQEERYKKYTDSLGMFSINR